MFIFANGLKDDAKKQMLLAQWVWQLLDIYTI